MSFTPPREVRNLRIALIAAPFIAVPPADYGGTELFVAHLAEGLRKSNIDVVVYANGESTVEAERRWLYEKTQWPIKTTDYAWLKELDHTAWAVADALKESDLIHAQSTQALALSRFANRPFVLTLHGPHESKLSEYFSHYQEVQYVAISEDQARQESLPKLRTIHHAPTQETRFLAEGKVAALAPTSAMICCAESTPKPGTSPSRCTAS